MDKAYYIQYYRFEREHWWFRARAEILRSYIEANLPTSGNAIVNVGAATGRTTEWLSNFGEVQSLEYEKDCIEFVKDKVPFPIRHGSVLELPYADNQFDLVCAFDVIEHVENDLRAVQEMMRVCRPGGSMMITVPAHQHLWSDHDEINHHFRRYSIESLQKLVGQAGQGEIVFTSYFNSRLYPLIRWARKLGNAKNRLWKPRQVKSDFDKFPAGFLNSLLYTIMAGERKTLMKQEKLGTGVSILLHWRKE